jgi:short-subunit dehydrogenase
VFARSPVRQFGPGQVAAITGAASGIGRALATQLAQAGVVVSLADADESGLAEVGSAIRQQGGRVQEHPVDVTDADQVDRWATATIEEFGRVDLVANVAGIINAGDAVDSTLTELHRLLDVDFWGVIHGSKAFLPHLIAAGRGHLINVSSALGLISVPGYGGYNAAKFAVRGWSDALRLEMRRNRTGVTVTCVYPGGVRTPIMAHATSAAGPEDAARRRKLFDTRIARTEPEEAAAAILRGAAAGRRRVLVGADARLADLMARVTGSGYERVFEIGR